MNDDVRKAWGKCLKPKYLPRGWLFRSHLGVSLRLADVIPKTVTLRRDLSEALALVKSPPRALTPFREVNIVPFYEAMPDEVLEFVRSPLIPCSDPNMQAPQLFQIFLECIEGSWDTSKFHLIFHSSGWDSRILSWAVKTLYEKNGPSWLGDVLFVEWSCENEPFEQIMRAEGWDESQWTIHRPEAFGTLEYHVDSLEFRGAWERLNWCAQGPISIFYDTAASLQERGLVPEDDLIQGCTGQYANGIPKNVEMLGVTGAIRTMLQTEYCVTPLKGDYFWPYFYLPWIAAKCVSASGTRRSQKRIMEALTPELSHIRRLSSRDVRRGPCRLITKELRVKAEQDVRSSWYGRVYQHRRGCQWTSPCALTFHTAWAHWTLASLCEHLLEQGHTIKVEK